MYEILVANDVISTWNLFGVIYHMEFHYSVFRRIITRLGGNLTDILGKPVCCGNTKRISVTCISCHLRFRDIYIYIVVGIAVVNIVGCDNYCVRCAYSYAVSCTHYSL